MVRRHGWKLFIVIALTGLVPAALVLVAPEQGVGIFALFGHEAPADVAETDFMLFVVRWIGTVLVGSNLLTIFIAATALRRGAPWAWYAMWYWPAMFATHLAIYDGGARISQAVWTTLTVVALVVLRPAGRARQHVGNAANRSGTPALG